MAKFYSLYLKENKSTSPRLEKQVLPKQSTIDFILKYSKSVEFQKSDSKHYKCHLN